MKEGFSYGFEWPAGAPASHPFQAQNVWPGAEAAGILGASWRERMLDFFLATTRLSAEVVAALAEALPGAAEELPALCRGGDTISQMRMFHYLPPPKACGGSCLGSSPHTDWHLVTIISRDAASRLQHRLAASGV